MPQAGGVDGVAQLAAHSAMIAYAVLDNALSSDYPLGIELEVFVRREDAERYIKEVRGNEPEIAARQRIEERERLERGPNVVGAMGAPSSGSEISTSFWSHDAPWSLEVIAGPESERSRLAPHLAAGKVSACSSPRSFQATSDVSTTLPG